MIDASSMAKSPDVIFLAKAREILTRRLRAEVSSFALHVLILSAKQFSVSISPSS